MPEQDQLVRTIRRHRHRPAQASRLCEMLEGIEGALLCVLVITTPWLFGCTEDWSIKLMNWSCFALGLVSLAAYFLQRKSGEKTFQPGMALPAKAFLVVNLLLLGYCLVAFLNARATFSIPDQTFTYRTHVISWLPTSYDKSRSAQFLINGAAFFALFWATRHWVVNGTEGPLNARLKILLWVLAVNGFLLALQGTLQRISNSSQLLWFRPSWSGQVDACFGPFSYRGNAVDFLNLTWPVTFGFWHCLVHRRKVPLLRIGDGAEVLLLPMFLGTAAASFITLSRGGALVAGILLILVVPIVLAARSSKIGKAGFVFLLLVLALSVGFFSWGDLAARFKAAFSDGLSGRTEIYRNAQEIAADFPVFGTGPGTFQSVYHLYRQNPGELWAGFLHDDWLETRVTFGWVGMSLVLLQLALLAAWPLLNRRQWISPVLTLSLFLSLAGCLIHAKADFPFQTYAIVFTFVFISAILTVSMAVRPEESEQLEPKTRNTAI